MTSWRARISDERGSALLASIAFMAVTMVLGLALFELGTIENSLVLSEVATSRAFEVAQAGIERALDRLVLTMRAEQAELVSALAHGVPSWADGSTSGGATIDLCTGGCDTTADATVRAFRDANTAYITNTAFSGGTYAIAFRLLTQGEARNWPYGQTCRIRVGGNPANDDEFCTDLIFVRSTGAVAGPPGYTGTRTIQVLARGAAGSGVVSGLTIGSQTQSINGNVNIAGSINVIDTPSSATKAWEFRGGAGQQNNWSGLASSVLDRLRPLQLICPPGRNCTSPSDFVESLNATLTIQKPLDKRAVDINSGSVTVGTASDSATYGAGTAFNPTRPGKGPINQVAIADGCVMPCTQNGTYVPGDPGSIGSFTGRTDQVFVDGNNITRPYPVGAPTSFPLLTDPSTILGTTYTHYACPQGSSCAGTTGGTQEFFVSNALNLSTSFNLQSSTPAITINGVAFIDKTTGTRVTTGSICFNRVAGSGILEFFTQPSCTGSYTSTLNPLLVYTTGTFVTSGLIQYSGAAIFLVAPASSSGVIIGDSLTNACVPIGGDPCGRKFLNDPTSLGTTDMLAILTTGAAGNGNMALNGHNSDAVMGVLYAGVPPAVAGGQTNTTWQLTVVGSITTSALNMTQVPYFYEVPGGLVAELSFGNTSAWQIGVVPGFWRICGFGATQISPTTPVGLCGYQ
jgi:hypothetical protein